MSSKSGDNNRNDLKSPVVRRCTHMYTTEEEPKREISRIDSVFQAPDLILKIGTRKLHVTTEEFKKISIVFEKMIVNEFREKKTKEINFAGKDYKTFVMFIRTAHPGIQDPFEEETIHQILPLIDEYLAEDARERADDFLANIMKKKGEGMKSEELVEEMVEAEKYKLKNCLKILIGFAAKRLRVNLRLTDAYDDLSLHTKYRIMDERVKEMDGIYSNAYNSVQSGSAPYSVHKKLGESIFQWVKRH